MMSIKTLIRGHYVASTSADIMSCLLGQLKLHPKLLQTGVSNNDITQLYEYKFTWSLKFNRKQEIQEIAYVSQLSNITGYF